MRSPRCAPLLLLVLLPLLLLTPPAGDTAVITGVSGPGAPVCPRRARDAPRSGEGEVRGTGRVAPRGALYFSRPLAHLEKCLAPKAADDAGHWARPGRKSDQGVPP